MSKKNKGKKGKRITRKAMDTRIEKMLEAMAAWRAKAHLTKKKRVK